VERCKRPDSSERFDLLVQAGADPRHLGLGDAGFDAERGDEVVDTSPVDIRNW
jgi:hypothetical protein